MVWQLLFQGVYEASSKLCEFIVLLVRVHSYKQTHLINTWEVRYLALGRHRITSWNEGTLYKCIECDFTFVKLKTFDKHMKRKHYRGNWSNITLEISTRPSRMTRNGLKQEKLNCNQCNFTFVKIKLFQYTHEESTSPEESWTSLWQTR